MDQLSLYLTKRFQKHDLAISIMSVARITAQLTAVDAVGRDDGRLYYGIDLLYRQSPRAPTQTHTI